MRVQGDSRGPVGRHTNGVKFRSEFQAAHMVRVPCNGMAQMTPLDWGFSEDTAAQLMKESGKAVRTASATPCNGCAAAAATTVERRKRGSEAALDMGLSHRLRF